MAEQNQSVVTDLGLMLFGVVMFFAAVSALMALSVLLLLGLNDEGIHPVAAIVLAGMVTIAGWNIVASIRLLLHPEMRTALGIIGRSAIALIPVLLAIVIL